jgi:hypothetical protein
MQAPAERGRALTALAALVLSAHSPSFTRGPTQPHPGQLVAGAVAQVVGTFFKAHLAENTEPQNGTRVEQGGGKTYLALPIVTSGAARCIIK